MKGDPPALELAVLTGDSVSIFPVPKAASVRIGRGSDNDVVIDDASVSRRHALLHAGPPLTLEDLGSANGTQVHEPRGPGPSGDTVGLRRITGQRVLLAVGDIVTFGAVTA